MRLSVARRTSHVSKCVHCMWDYSGFTPHELEGLEGMKVIDGLRGQLKAGRTPPMAPHTFGKSLRERVGCGEVGFSSDADVDLVIEMYRRGFVSVFEGYRGYDPDGFFAAWAALEWGEAEARQIAAALAYAVKHCKGTNGGISLRLEGNAFGKDGMLAIEKAMRGSKVFKGRSSDRLTARGRAPITRGRLVLCHTQFSENLGLPLDWAPRFPSPYSDPWQRKGRIENEARCSCWGGCVGPFSDFAFCDPSLTQSQIRFSHALYGSVYGTV